METPRVAQRVGLAGLAIAVLLALFPLGPRVETRTGNIYVATVATLVWLLAWLAFAFAGPRRGLSLSIPPQKALFAYGAFLGLQLLFHLGSLLDRPAFLLRAIQLLAYMGLFTTISSMSLDVRFARRLVVLAVVIFVVECVVSLSPGNASAHGFLTGTFDREHNSFAAYLLLMACILFALLSNSTSRAHGALLALFLLCAIVFLALSFSRTAYVAMPVALLGLVHRRWGIRPAIASAVALMLVATLLGIVLPTGVRDRFASIVEIASGEGQDISFMTRLALWETGISELIRTGFLGVGIYGFHYVDNYFVRTFIETGPIGLGIFLWFLAAVLLWLWRAYECESDTVLRSLALGLYGATIGLLGVMSLATDSLLVHRVMGVYWVLLATLVAAHGARQAALQTGGAVAPTRS